MQAELPAISAIISRGDAPPPPPPLVPNQGRGISFTNLFSTMEDETLSRTPEPLFKHEQKAQSPSKFVCKR
jgi:hypothetical protein